MNRPVIKGANPSIIIGKDSINTTCNYNDPDYDETVPPLYQGFLNDGNLKVRFAVIWNNQFDESNQKMLPENKHYREFQVVKYEALYLHGIDKGASIDHTEQSGVISANPEIVHMLFQKVLDPYGIRLDKVTMHGYKDFVSTDFSFIDEIKKEKLEALIDYIFRKNLT